MARGGKREDVEHCLALLREGSKSFHAASLLLPRRLRADVAAVYAFCRVSDDAVDESDDPHASLTRLRERLDEVFRGEPADDPVDRALSEVVSEHGLPREPFDALLEGYLWDAENRRYEDLDALVAYCVRVAASVGVLMTVLMGERRGPVLDRASDLGIAMQLTNIARDVGEDARRGRIYLPMEWLAEVGLSAEDLVPAPRMRPELGLLVKRLLGVADVYYARSQAGIPHLPRDCRVAIAAAAHIYRDIGRAIVVSGYDSISRRAYTSAPRKAWLLCTALPSMIGSAPEPSGPPAAVAARALVEATAEATR
jgi:phytoene synthase